MCCLVWLRVVHCGLLLFRVIVHYPESWNRLFCIVSLHLSIAGILVVVLQCFSELQSGVEPLLSMLQTGSLCCCVSLWFTIICTLFWGLNCVQYLGVEETPNGIDKPSSERNLTKEIRVVA